MREYFPAELQPTMFFDEALTNEAWPVNASGRRRPFLRLPELSYRKQCEQIEQYKLNNFS